MKIHLFLIGLILLFSSSGKCQTSPVLLSIQGKDIPKSDFEKYLIRQSKADKELDKESCFKEYVFHRLKIADAIEQGWNHLPVFVQQYKTELGQRQEDVFVGEMSKDSLLNQLYTILNKRFSTGEWVKISQIFIPLSQNAGKQSERLALVRMDSICKALQNGGRFEDFVVDGSCWMPKYGLLQEVQSALSGLSVGEYTQPFISPMGAHIVKLEANNDKFGNEDFMSFVSAYAGNYKLLQGRAAKEKLQEWSQKSAALAGGIAESIRDSLLVSYWDKKNGVDSGGKVDSLSLEHYFNANKRKYNWTLPHFKGAVIQCSNKKEASQIKKLLKNASMQEWVKVIAEWNRTHTDSPAQIDCGLFRIGQNAYVDKLEFKCGDLPVTTGYVFTNGKKLKGPDSYLDVYNKVEKDYQLTEKKSLIDSLKSHFDVKINPNVLKTVNCSDGK